MSPGQIGLNVMSRGWTDFRVSSAVGDIQNSCAAPFATLGGPFWPAAYRGVTYSNRNDTIGHPTA